MAGPSAWKSQQAKICGMVLDELRAEVIALSRKAAPGFASIERHAGDGERQHGGRHAVLLHVIDRLFRGPCGHFPDVGNRAAKVHVERRKHMMVHVDPATLGIGIDTRDCREHRAG